MKINYNPINKQVLLTAGLIVIILALAASLVLINYLLAEKLLALQNATQTNATRITNIENYLNQAIQAAQNQQSGEGGTVEQK